MKLSFTVPGAPYGKPRPRVTQYGAYTEDKCVAYEELVRLRYREAAALRGWKGYVGPVNVRIQANYSVPKHWNKDRRTAALAGAERPTRKPDCDNIAKVILDALNGIAYRDDAAVVGLQVQKRFVTQKYQEQSVFVEIWEVDDGKRD